MCIRYRGKLRQHKLIRVQCTKKSTRVPVSPVPSTGIRFKKVKIIKTYNPYTKILNFVLLIWEERNLERYEHARACRERVRAPRARQKIHQSSNDIIFVRLLRGAFLCISYRGKLRKHKLIRVQLYSVPKKVPEYRYPLYPVRVFGLKK